MLTITIPFPLSGFVMMMLSSLHKSFKAVHSSLLRIFLFRKVIGVDLIAGDILQLTS